jgi:hypothetical protein
MCAAAVSSSHISFSFCLSCYDCTLHKPPAFESNVVRQYQTIADPELDIKIKAFRDVKLCMCSPVV